MPNIQSNSAAVLWLPQFEMQRAQSQPRRALPGFVTRDRLDLSQRFGVPLGHAESARIDHADGTGTRVGLQIAHDDGFRLGHHRKHRHSEQHRALCRFVLNMGTLGVIERFGVVAGCEP